MLMFLMLRCPPPHDVLSLVVHHRHKADIVEHWAAKLEVPAGHREGCSWGPTVFFWSE